ncbi:glycosyltransferase [Altererythrobacter aurantiacus]|uniref:Glycosyltransferase n=1 Tax=Parapontixanthobacter aurantiacus TaxID=1463599 RepID=A0A844ZG70_9SPHN|nr:glycosyltransferase [Parapontixanthobacter aurantiacus]MXO85980.1 glycosyltransferase [Parapontixanthobacter aurantiacus]
MSDSVDLTIIVPAYNEEGSIEDTVKELHPIAQEAQGQLMVVNDGSSDRTAEILELLVKYYPRLRVLHHEYNQGYGAALKTGLQAAKTELIAITDADGTYPNDRLLELARACRDKDMVVGSRTGPGVVYSKVRAVPKIFLKRWVSWIAGRTVPDINSGLRVFRAETARKFLGIYPNGFSFTITITLAMLTTRRQVQFIPISYAARVGQSKIKPVRDTLRFLNIIMRTGTYFAPIRAFLPLVAILFLAATVSLGFDIWNGDLTEKTLLLYLFSFNTGMFTLLADMIDKRSQN